MSITSGPHRAWVRIPLSSELFGSRENRFCSRFELGKVRGGEGPNLEEKFISLSCASKYTRDMHRSGVS